MYNIKTTFLYPCGHKASSFGTFPVRGIRHKLNRPVLAIIGKNTAESITSSVEIHRIKEFIHSVQCSVDGLSGKITISKALRDELKYEGNIEC